ncbi:MAG TPA: hypothetical protein VL486_13390 [Verrucomicrobiae bacterium]|nr:hypothetical protein [Verrucomicrobiae bacterium]
MKERIKRKPAMSPAQQIIYRISELRDLSRKLARAGFEAGLHTHDPDRLPAANKVAERRGVYSTRRRPR